ncbi:hypothetical protein [Amycolatopsis sp. BJA-103]|uniref:hypothetical protein n=1 Tax=unclassified Amycolatopsis TaxID=2618356 RepID=UPI000C76681F|nr:hypothetical protein [Amycolatopsis sp. BJA-103]AUI59138.1 hypothetical protein BKN51_13570 [Amycolatopsis sp. BJA-103]PNE17414.1 hypothetical protein B1H26_20955 [Amycolatopsis sp. BJA-103]
MLEVELDIFSGMPNPTWTLSEREERELIERISADPAQVSPAVTPDEQFSLGYRGLLVRLVKTDGGPRSELTSAWGTSLPTEFRIGSKPATEPVADWLLGTSEAYPDAGVDDELREVASSGVDLVQSSFDAVDPASFVSRRADGAAISGLEGEGAHAPNEPGGDVHVEGASWWDCNSNYFNANASLFNQPEHVGRNNCYCFASNHLAGARFARPGKRGGHPATSITCGGVTNGLYADGWKDGCQTNGLTIVLVIWPNRDYHFYRLVTDAPYWWWGHKPGATPAKYTDDCGHSIYQYNGQGYAPNNCCRGNYTNFCGYFYQNNSTALVA